MKRFLFAGLLSLACVFGPPAATATSAAVHNEIRAKQALGRVVVAPDGSFFIYEWKRPYTWTPGAKGLAPAAAARPQTWMYKVGTDYPVTPSYYLFHPHPRATYYLGDLSPDNQRIAFYELDRTENTLRAGVVTFDHPAYPMISWFDASPTSESLGEPALWVSKDELAYQTKSGFVRGKLPAPRKKSADSLANSGERYDPIVKTSPCADCVAHLRAKKRVADSAATAASEMDRKDEAADAGAQAEGVQVPKGTEPSKAAEIPKGAKLLARSENGELSVYAVDTPEVLTLLYKKGDSVRTLFENDRKPNKLARD